MLQRWRQLPLDHAQARMPSVRQLLDDLSPGQAVPDLGPSVVMDQLTVLVYDACVAGEPGRIQSRLRELLRALD